MGVSILANITISYSHANYKQVAELTAAELDLPLVMLEKELTFKTLRSDQSLLPGDYTLYFSTDGLALLPIKQNDSGLVSCDFVTGSNRHRVNYGGGNGQSIAKAVGVSGKFHPHVLDVTAGLGRDAFILASLGCSVSLLERNPIVYKLLEDGIRRAQSAAESDPQLDAIVDRMQLLKMDSLQYLDALNEDALEDDTKPDIIYIDPMFPLRKKSAKVKKDMQALHSIVGADEDSGQIIDKALSKARYRVVIKRPTHAGFLADIKPNYSLSGKTTRFDIFALQKLPG